MPTTLLIHGAAPYGSSEGGNYNPKIQRCRKMMRVKENSAGDYRETIIRPTLSSNSNATTTKRQPHPQHEACMFIRSKLSVFSPPAFAEQPATATGPAIAGPARQEN